VFLGDGSSKALQKTFYKKIVSKSFYKKIDKKSQTDFFLIFCHVFWAFLGGGSSKTGFKKNLAIPASFFFGPPRSQPTT
jgi:hypothetical protein